MLRTCAMGWSPAHLIAAYVLSLVFYWRQFNLEESEVSLVFWTGVFLSPGRRIRVTGKETGPGPGGYG